MSNEVPLPSADGDYAKKDGGDVKDIVASKKEPEHHAERKEAADDAAAKRGGAMDDNSSKNNNSTHGDKGAHVGLPSQPAPNSPASRRVYAERKKAAEGVSIQRGDTKKAAESASVQRGDTMGDSSSFHDSSNHSDSFPASRRVYAERKKAAAAAAGASATLAASMASVRKDSKAVAPHADHPSQQDSFPASRRVHAERKKAATAVEAAGASSQDSLASAPPTGGLRLLAGRATREDESGNIDNQNDSFGGTALIKAARSATKTLTKKAVTVKTSPNDSDAQPGAVNVPIPLYDDNFTGVSSGGVLPFQLASDVEHQNHTLVHDDATFASPDRANGDDAEGNKDNKHRGEEEEPDQYLLEATAVEEVELALAVQVEPTNRKRQLFLALLALAVVTGVVVGTVLGSRGGSTKAAATTATIFLTQAPTQIPAPSEQPTQQPTQQPSQRPSQVWTFLSPNTLEVIHNDSLGTTPQAIALRALEYHPDISSMPEWKIEQLFALMAFFESTTSGGVAWSDVECSWNAGVICDPQGHLQSLDIIWDSLQGTIPPEMHLLSNLSSLMLVGNAMSGSLPTEIGMMTALQVLGLFSNRMQGRLPTELGLLSLLSYVNIGGPNFMTGSVPSEFGMLSALTYLGLHMQKYLSGQLPTELGMLKSASWLELYENDFSGTIPTELGRMTNLSDLRLHLNPQLSGQVPSELAQLAVLDYLTLTNTSLTGTVPSSICSFARLNLHIDCEEVNCNCTPCRCWPVSPFAGF